MYIGESIKSVGEESGQGALEYFILTATGLAVIATGTAFMRKVAIESNLKSERAYGRINQSIEDILDEIVEESEMQTTNQAQTSPSPPPQNTPTPNESTEPPYSKNSKCWVCGPQSPC